MEYKIRGTTLPILDIELNQGESIYSESGGMAWMSENITMETSTKGGFLNSFKRTIVGESFFMTNYTCEKGTGIIAFCSESPGKIIPVTLNEGESLICQKDAFMVAEKTININSKFVGFGKGLFGGEGMFLQKIEGFGKVFLELAGEITEYNLEEGETLKIDPGFIGAFEPTVKYEITRIKGLKNILFSGEGLFLATLTGPGRVLLQSMPLPNLARKLSRYIYRKK